MPIRLRIGNDDFEFYENGTITLNYGMATNTFNFNGFYDPTSELYRRVFRPLQYKPVTIDTLRGERLINGFLTNTSFKSSEKTNVAGISGYSKTGLIQDCTIPIGQPYQYIGLSLREIAEQLVQRFNISVVVENDNGLADEEIDEQTAKPSETINQFLTRIAAQKNLVISSGLNGELKIARTIVARESIATYRDGLPSTSISLQIGGQAMFSDITTLQQADFDSANSGQETVNNPLVNAFRPTTKIQSAGDFNETLLASQNVRANQLRNIRLIIESDRWEWLNNRRQETITPDNIVTVISPRNYINRPTNFFVEQVKLNLTPKKETATLFCVLPEVYNNEAPKIFF